MLSSTLEEATVRNILGVSPSAFIQDVRNMVDSHIKSLVQDFQNELRRIPNATLSEPEIEEIGVKLNKILNKKAKRNMDKFELYALRNIFVLKKAEAKRRRAIEPGDISAKRKLYIQKVNELRNLQLRYEQKKLLLEKMTNAIFEYKLARQSLDDNDVQPLKETFQNMREASDSLKELCIGAKDLIDEINSSTKFITDHTENTHLNESTKQQSLLSSSDQIDDIAALNSYIR